MWIARDKNGSLYLYEYKPIKSQIFKQWVPDTSLPKNKSALYFDDFDSFPEVKWKDEEPTEVELVIKK